MKSSKIRAKLYMVTFIIVLDKRLCNCLLLIVANLQSTIFFIWICVKSIRKIETLFFVSFKYSKRNSLCETKKVMLKSYEISSNGFGNVKKKNLK